MSDMERWGRATKAPKWVHEMNGIGQPTGVIKLIEPPHTRMRMKGRRWVAVR